MDILIGTSKVWEQNREIPVHPIFDRKVLDFLADLSSSLLADTEAQAYSDVVAFALWCRQSALESMKSAYLDENLYLGRGLAFHISPANVPIMFAYTLTLGLLSGNANVVRVPSREFPQIQLLCNRIGSLLQRECHHQLADYIACIRYNREDQEITKMLSELCDVRVIWGGDASVREIRQHRLQPQACEMVFPNRFSIAIINTDAWLRCADKTQQIRGFFNDTYFSNQASCSSPRLVFWLGNKVEEARADFWSLVESSVAQRYQGLPIQAIKNIEFSYCVLAKNSSFRLCSTNPQVTRIWCEAIDPEIIDEHPGGGIFFETQGKQLHDLLPVLKRKCQSISYYGVSITELRSFFKNACPAGGDRVVPMGQTLNFSLTWDGYDTIRTLSRRLEFVAKMSSMGPEL